MSLTAATKLHAVASSAQRAQLVSYYIKGAEKNLWLALIKVVHLGPTAAILQYTNVTDPIRVVHCGTDLLQPNSVSVYQPSCTPRIADTNWV